MVGKNTCISTCKFNYIEIYMLNFHRIILELWSELERKNLFSVIYISAAVGTYFWTCVPGTWFADDDQVLVLHKRRRNPCPPTGWSNGPKNRNRHCTQKDNPLRLKSQWINKKAHILMSFPVRNYYKTYQSIEYW